MTLHASAVATLTLWRAPSPAQAEHRARFLSHLAAHDDGLARSCFPEHLTAGAIVVSPDGDRVLLNHHRKADAWLAFGGHLEPEDHSLSAGARRELREESGLTEFELGYVQHFRRFALRGSGRVDTKGVVGAGLTLSFSVGRDELDGGDDARPAE